ncbi:MAG: PIN domain-containing protein [Victivallales bacterium]|nr:PIN domain-containing protein [Victivallales bacterium]
MRVLFDANVILTYLTKRDDPYLQEVEILLWECSKGNIEGFVSLQTLSIVWYVMRKIPSNLRRKKISAICRILGLATTNMKAIQNAIDNSDFSDFEDSLQDCCAQEIHADYIVTANIDDFLNHSIVLPITPTDILPLICHSWASVYSNFTFAMRPPGDVRYDNQLNVIPHQHAVSRCLLHPHIHTIPCRYPWEHFSRGGCCKTTMP